MTDKTLPVDGTDYRWPADPVVVVGIDGGDPRYRGHGVHEASLPIIRSRSVSDGYARRAKDDGLHSGQGFGFGYAFNGAAASARSPA